MENIGEVLLTKEQQTFISSMINMYGGDEHPIANSNTFEHFKIDYVRKLTEKPEVLANLNSKGVSILNEVKTALVNPCGHYDVKVDSLWDYVRLLDCAKNTVGLKVKEVKDGLVTFYEKMPYLAYGIEYFDGKTFKPHVKE